MKRFDEICRYIEEHLDQPLSVDESAKCAHLSPYHFIRRFRRAYHRTPHQYLIYKRLERAKALLAHSEFFTKHALKPLVLTRGVSTLAWPMGI